MYPGRPSRTAQQAGADEVIEAIEAKLTRPSYKPMLESYGYGVLVVGLPLWFATLPIDPLRPENAIDDFATRTAAGLALLGRKYLRDTACPFGQVIVPVGAHPEGADRMAIARTIRRVRRSALPQDEKSGQWQQAGASPHRGWKAVRERQSRQVHAGSYPASLAP